MSTISLTNYGYMVVRLKNGAKMYRNCWCDAMLYLDALSLANRLNMVTDASDRYEVQEYINPDGE